MSVNTEQLTQPRVPRVASATECNAMVNALVCPRGTSHLIDIPTREEYGRPEANFTISRLECEMLSPLDHEQSPCHPCLRPQAPLLSMLYVIFAELRPAAAEVV